MQMANKNSKYKPRPSHRFRCVPPLPSPPPVACRERALGLAPRVADDWCEMPRRSEGSVVLSGDDNNARHPPNQRAGARSRHVAEHALDCGLELGDCLGALARGGLETEARAGRDRHD